MAAYYNEFDRKTAAWLRELIKAGLIADGEVDERSITDVQPADLAGFTQCHFFAGIGGWSYALRLAGWPDDRECWSGSCPCQPFSSAGTQAGGADARDLWPAWFRLIRECRPVVVFGEQVESAIGHGWIDRLCDDMESEDYAVGPVGLPAACVGAFHNRPRLWFVAYAQGGDGRLPVQQWRPLAASTEPERRSETGGVADTDIALPGDGGLQRGGRLVQPAEDASPGDVGHAYSTRHAFGMGGGRDDAPASGTAAGQAVVEASPARGFWADADWIACSDGKARPVEPGTFPLAHGLPARVGRLRGYGNAIVPQVAAEVIAAYMDITG